MARKKPQPQVPDTLKNLVQDVGKPVSSSDVDSYGKLRQIQDRSHQIRTIVKAWKDQQAQDRKMRERYAIYLIVAMGVQALVVNVVFVLMGCGVLSFEAWTAKTFIMSVFAEIAAMVLIVVKYLFTPSSEKVLQFLDEKRATGKGR
ncbi:MAG: hypothetical protein HYS12_21450 [Planctomycetes bacterium]|nr:hypothetical protein [Planctomycetota bacterium]